MLRSTVFVRHLATFGALLPLALLLGACSDDDASDGPTDEGAGGASASGGRSSSSTGGKAPSSTGGKSSTGGGSGASAGLPTEGPAPVSLGAAKDYAILAKSAISNVPTSSITGDLGLSPAAASYITGFELTKAGTTWSSPEVTGDVFAADNDPPTPDALTTAVADMQTAYTDAAGRKNAEFLNLGAGDIGGLTLAPGLYHWASTLTIPSDITLSGSADSVWIFQVTGDLQMSAGQAMILKGGARAENIVWQVAGAMTFGTASHAEGILLSKTGIDLGTGASINGRLLAQMAVTLAGATVTAPAR